MGGRRAQKKVPRGSIGEKTFAEVEQLTAGGAMTRLAAFEAIAKRIGSQPGTVAANYYRVARKRGGTVKSRSRRSGGSTAGAVLAVLSAAVKRIETVLGAQEKELAALRKENHRVEALRRLLKA